jgi:hypothetical protein
LVTPATAAAVGINRAHDAAWVTDYGIIPFIKTELLLLIVKDLNGYGLLLPVCG